MIKLYLMEVSPLEEESYFTQCLALVEPERRERLQAAKGYRASRALRLAAGMLAAYAAGDADALRAEAADGGQAVPAVLTVAAEEAAERLRGMPPVKIKRLPTGKPFYPDMREIFFNLSHSGQYAVCALSDRPVGVDIQQRKNAGARLRERILCQGAGRAKEETEEFFRLWSVKEACVKCTGAGLSKDFRELAVDPETRVVRDLVTGEIFSWYTPETPKDYSLAVCSACGGIQ